ncbi:DUF4386 domain-containing protein [Marispirochaeta sp.]|uniref:DUF4386 domain-containing protein n=1 Tax=Marispirochaeta sp. TaxID=2038653 RepID=UPI0029C7739D|nr:DUF4386 domain-containing protein [Marispirochaeta sp.]
MILTEKNISNADVSIQKAALISGVSLLLMTVIAFISFPILQNYFEPEDAAQTAMNIIENQFLFRIILCSFLIIIFLDIIVAWALYVFLKPVNTSLALLMGLFRIVYAAIFATALNNLFSVLHLLSNNSYTNILKIEQIHAQSMVFINAFNFGWDIGLAVFGIHIIILGYLVYKSGYVPKTLGILVSIASLGYLIDSFGKFILFDYSLSIGMFTFIGEVLLAFWLLLKGIKGFTKKSKNDTAR